MKNILIGLTTFVIALLTVAGLLAMHTRGMAKTELEDALSNAVEQSLENAMSGEAYDVDDTDEFVADIMESILLQIDSDADITIHVLNADLEKGILSVEATEEFEYIGGKKGTVSAKKTAVLDSVTTTEEETYYKICFYVESEDGTENELYKSYSLMKGDFIPEPKTPELDYATFSGWLDADGNEVSITEQTVESDTDFYAKLN